ncbi:hypothetical protein ES702_01451 [subsurface metagenome]
MSDELEYYKIIQEVADKKFNWIIDIEAIEDFFEIVKIVDKRIIKGNK